MNFEKTLKKITATISLVLLYILAASFYLTGKGFVKDENGGFVLVNKAQANEVEDVDILLNYAFPRDHIMGKKDAPVTLYEYSSFGCGHCADFHLTMLPKLEKEYVEKGLLNIVFVPLPLDQASMSGALLAECVDKDKYFDFVKVLFDQQADWLLSFNPKKKLLQYAGLSGLNQERAKLCLKDDKAAALILKNRQDGLKDLNIKGTPSFVIASKHKNEFIGGIKPLSYFKMVIDEFLAEESGNIVEKVEDKSTKKTTVKIK